MGFKKAVASHQYKSKHKLSEQGFYDFLLLLFLWLAELTELETASFQAANNQEKKIKECADLHLNNFSAILLDYWKIQFFFFCILNPS